LLAKAPGCFSLPSNESSDYSEEGNQVELKTSRCFFIPEERLYRRKYYLMIRELIITNISDVREQPAADPNLCPWAEWYYSVLLAFVAENGSTTQLERINVFIDGIEESASIVSKDTIRPVSIPSVSERSSVRLGASTSLVLTGSLQNAILVPNGRQTFTFGRQLKPDFAYFSEMYADRQAQKQLQTGGAKDPYLEAQYQILESGKNKFQVSTYRQLFEAAKQVVVSTFIN
jgi:hypothetical protein